MPIQIPSSLVDFILLGPADDRRQLQDSPILGDVWIEFGKAPKDSHDLLISPFKTQHAGNVAAKIQRNLNDGGDDDANIAYLQGLVVAKLTFPELLRVVVPKTEWWIDKWTKDAAPEGAASDTGPAANNGFVHEVRRRFFGTNQTTDLHDVMLKIIAAAEKWNARTGDRQTLELTPFDRFAALAVLILWAGQSHNNLAPGVAADERVRFILEKIRNENEQAVSLFKTLADLMLADETWKSKKFDGERPLIWSVSCNRAALPAIARSVPAVKADAATTLFKVNCSEIAWAVLDSGIDGNHPAFGKADGSGSRVVRSFDFRNFRRIVSLSNEKPQMRKKNLAEILTMRPAIKMLPDHPEEALERLAKDALDRRPIDWELVGRFVEINPGTPPPTNHGTHVAGIIGSSEKAVKASMKEGASAAPTNPSSLDGMCPDISLFDFRVLGATLRDTEFAIIAALQFIRYLNDRDSFLSIHGANLSLSIPHDVRNFACGRTPICNECERLIDSGVVVVAAAGNHGYKSFETKDGAYESYAAFSITDPGNADGVITVGATHRYWPHTYGVSFFSSRGPTGDGRLKPDLVAPGERIRAPFPNGVWGDLDGTSMAAPHVSGAAAMLLARYSELIGRPRRVKQILCEAATDLGRERSFQGRGMLDVLRAFQSI